MKMAIESLNNEKEKTIDLLCDVQVMLGLVVVCPQSHQVSLVERCFHL
jgi:hypothetical protein